MKKMIVKIKDRVEYIVDMYFRDPLFWLGVFGACHGETMNESTARNLWWTMYNVQRILNH